MKACISTEFQWRERESILIFINWAVVGLPGRVQKQMVLKVHRVSVVCLGGSGHVFPLPYAVLISKQTPIPTVWLCILQKRGSGCASSRRVPGKEAAPHPSTGPLVPPRREPPSPAGAGLVPQKFMFNDIPEMSSQCDLCFNSGL